MSAADVGKSIVINCDGCNRESWISGTLTSRIKVGAVLGYDVPLYCLFCGHKNEYLKYKNLNKIRSISK